MRYLFLLFFSVLAFASPEQCPGYVPGLQMHDKPRIRNTHPTSLPSIVHIETRCGWCTGWVADKNLIVTAAHCMQSKYEESGVRARFVDGRIAPLLLVVKGVGEPNSDTDVAVLSGDTKDIAPLALELNPKSPFQCITVGYGPQGTQKAALCLGRVPDPGVPGIHIYMGSVDHGDSGGPVLNVDGKVTGLQNMVHYFNEKIFFSVPSTMIHKYLMKSGLYHEH